MQLPIVYSLSKSEDHSFVKQRSKRLNVIAGLGIEGDAHMGRKVKHRSRVRKNPDEANLRQVHLIHLELYEELRMKGFDLKPGELGENITTENIDLLSLAKHSILKVGNDVSLRITGLRNPCGQLDDLHMGLMKAVLDQDENGELIRKCGVMSTVVSGGRIAVGDKIEIILPEEPHEKLQPV